MPTARTARRVVKQLLSPSIHRPPPRRRRRRDGGLVGHDDDASTSVLSRIRAGVRVPSGSVPVAAAAGAPQLRHFGAALQSIGFLVFFENLSQKLLFLHALIPRRSESVFLILVSFCDKPHAQVDVIRLRTHVQ